MTTVKMTNMLSILEHVDSMTPHIVPTYNNILHPYHSLL